MSTASREDQQPSRYAVGIDLGTTNSAVAYVDSAEEPWRVREFAVVQLVAPGETEARETLPSFHYEAAEGEFAPGSLRLPWSAPDRPFAVGFFARDHGVGVPGRLISSAKSWLCHSGVDRTAELLPWHGAADVERLSPVEASSRYLAHIREAWDARFPTEPLSRQDVVLTLPASFDEVARELTVKAARLAGLPRVVLVEEPQAAFYSWIYAQGDQWASRVKPGQKILVCDIGGGTSDFTLIRVRRSGDAAGQGTAQGSGLIQFHRVAVGEHLILGGDNLDLALAHHLERRLAGDGKLADRQWAVLLRVCRQVKETLLGPDPPQKLVVNLPGSGSRLIGGGLQVEVTQQEAQELLLEGFLPRVALADKPVARRSGFQEFGLPYAPDAAMTRYLAAFLTAHREAEHNLGGDADNSAASAADPRGDAAPQVDPARPDLVLFNGGLFASPALRQRLLDVLSSWFREQGSQAKAGAQANWSPEVLENERLDLAVARGAAYYGMVRRGAGVRISAGLARTYYIGVETADAGAPTAVCLLPAGIEEGQTVDLVERPLTLLIRHPVEFPLYVSSTRLTDRPGQLLPIDAEQMSALPPIRTVLETGRKGAEQAVSVTLHARLTEIGTLDLWCSEVAGPRSWRLQFDVRAATQTDAIAHGGAGETQGFLDDTVANACRQAICQTWGDRSSRPESLVKQLEELAGLKRRDWPMSLLRSMWGDLMELEKGRRLSAEHEARWLYLLGFALRPGYGLAVDDWRVAQTWRLLQGKRLHHTPTCRVEWLILWRRIAGGLSSGQQRALAEPLLAVLRPLLGTTARARSRKVEIGSGSHETAEAWRLLGALELLGGAIKLELADAGLELLLREKVSAVRNACLWALGRWHARVPMYGPLNTVTPVEAVDRSLRKLMELNVPEEEAANFAVVQMARRTGDRHRDISEALREKVGVWLDRRGAAEHYRELVASGGQLREEEQGLMFGESLPRGLRLTVEG